jgi:hypothetical protein
MRAPTPRQIECYEAVRRHAGNQTAAGRELGISGTAVRQRLEGYAAATGESTVPRGMGRHSRRMIADLPGRLDEIESEIAEINAGIERLIRGVDRLAAQVDELNARQPILLNVQPSHRRKADGGTGGRQERLESPIR